MKKEIFGEMSISYVTKQPLEVSITSSDVAVSYLRDIWSDKIEYIEETYLIALNRANKVLGWVKISQGGTSRTVIDTKVVFQHLLLAHASSFIIAHNHPSGNDKPSTEDVNVTKGLKDAGDVMSIKMLDHIILTKESYYSFGDNETL